MKAINIKRWFQDNPVMILIILGALIIIPLFIVDYRLGVESKDFYINLTTSAIEVFFLGLVIIFYNKLSERKDRIKRYREEIDSYRPWKEDEATYRICGLVRNLNNLQVSDIDLSDCYLSKAPLSEANFQGANFQGADLMDANLQGADLRGANLQGANLWCANLQGTMLSHALLQETLLPGANLQGADLQGALLKKAFLQGTLLKRALLQEALLQEALLQGANLQGANLQGAKLQGAFVESKDWLLKVKKCGIEGIEYVKESYCVVEDESTSTTVYRIAKKQDQPS